MIIKLGAGLDRVRQVVVQLQAGYAGQGSPEQASLGQVRLGQQAAAAMVTGGPGVYQDEPAELVRVVPLAREVYYGPGLRIVLISLEIWSGWLDLRYAIVGEQPQEGPPEVLLGWRVSDDAGTGYEQTGMATGGGRLLRVSQLGFRPAPPAEARALTLTVVSGDEPAQPVAVVEIELTPGS